MALSTAEKLARVMGQHPELTEHEARLVVRRHARFLPGPAGGPPVFTTTPEHGSSSPLKAPPGRAIYETKSAQEAKRLINEAAAQGKRVSVGIVDKNNPVKPRVVWENRRGPFDSKHPRGHPSGIDAKYLKGHVGAQNFRAYLEGTTFGDKRYNNAYTPAGITKIQVTIYR